MIRFKQVKELIVVDLLQANRQTNDGTRTQNINKTNLAVRLLIQNGAFLLVYGLLFGSMLLNVPLPEFPGLFTSSISFMILFVFLQVFQLIFNLFYDDANLSEYLSLPFSKGELFLSKMLTIVLNTFAFFMLPLVLMSMLGWQAGHSLFLVIPIALLCTLLLMAIITLVPFVFIHLLHQLAFYRRHKKIFTIIIYIALFLLMFIGIYTNDFVSYGSGGLVDPDPNPLFVGFHEIFIPGQFLAGWLKTGIWGMVAVLLSAVAFQWIIPDLYSEEKQNTTDSQSAHKKGSGGSTLQSTSKWKVFLNYQLRQLQDTTFIIQMIFSKILLPLMFIGPTLIGEGGLDLTFLRELPNLWGVYLLVGALFALLTTGEISLSGVIISFDKENFHYIKSMPLSFRNYMRFKFWFSFGVEWLIGVIIFGGLSFIMNTPLNIFIIALVGFTIGTFITVFYFFMRDYRLLNLNWNNFSELMQRGLNQFIRLFFTFVILIAASLGIMWLTFWLLAQNNPTLTMSISALIAALFISIVFGLYYYSKKKFWIKFND
jgi:ABC-2 type transport system permease protein